MIRNVDHGWKEVINELLCKTSTRLNDSIFILVHSQNVLNKLNILVCIIIHFALVIFRNSDFISGTERVTYHKSQAQNKNVQQNKNCNKNFGVIANFMRTCSSLTYKLEHKVVKMTQVPITSLCSS